MWGLARQLTNKHIVDRDLSNPMPVIDPLTGVYQDTVEFNRLYVESEQSTFDENLRTSLFGKADSIEWIDLDNLSPDQLSIGYFSANELLNGGSNYVYYFGFDAFGNPIKGNTSLQDLVKNR